MNGHERTSRGRVYLVGAGPGDVGLLTLKGHELLERAEVILYDHLVNPAMLSLASPTALVTCVGSTHDPARLTQDEIHQFLIRHARNGKLVVRLKGGDPFIFGRGGEEAQALTEAGIEWEVVPGVSAGHAVPAYAGIPLTHRDHASSVAFVTGHECGDKRSVDWRKLATAVDTLVIFMAARSLIGIVASLLDAGRPRSTPIAVIEQGTSTCQHVRLATLGTIVDSAEVDPIVSPALIVVGKVAALHRQLGWFEPAFQATGVMDEVLSSVS